MTQRIALVTGSRGLGKRRVEAGGKGNRYSFDLSQQPPGGPDVVAEIEQGSKRQHWR